MHTESFVDHVFISFYKNRCDDKNILVFIYTHDLYVVCLKIFFCAQSYTGWRHERDYKGFIRLATVCGSVCVVDNARRDDRHDRLCI